LYRVTRKHVATQTKRKSAWRDANTARWRSQKFSPRRIPPSRGRRTAKI